MGGLRLRVIQGCQVWYRIALDWIKGDCCALVKVGAVLGTTVPTGHHQFRHRLLSPCLTVNRYYSFSGVDGFVLVEELTRAPSCGSRPSPGPAHTSSQRAASTGRGTFCSSPVENEQKDAIQKTVRGWKNDKAKDCIFRENNSLWHLFTC